MSACSSDDTLWCPQTPPPSFNSAVIRGWLVDQPSSLRKRARSPSPQLSQSGKRPRRPLQPMDAMANRRGSPRKVKPPRKGDKSQPLVIDADEDAENAGFEEDVALGDDATTPKPNKTKRGRQARREPPPSLDLAAAPAFQPPGDGASSNTYTRQLTQQAVLFEPHAEASTSSTRSNRSKKRATSPAKTYNDLHILNKPVRYGVMDVEGGDDLPAEIRTLVDDLQALCENVGILPSKMQDHMPGSKRRAHWTYDSSSRDDLDLQIELDTVKRAQASATSLSNSGDHEPQWYCSVQWPLLDMAFRHQSHIEPKQVSRALPIKECLPQTGDQLSESRLVDFAVNLVPPSISDESMSEWLRNRPTHLRSVNQSLYPPLCRHPTIISIEVKVGGTEEEARVQLGIWLSAWHERIRELGGDAGDDEDFRVITLPVIIVLNHYWHLYFAVDRGSHIEILQFPESIGDTLSVVKTYRILAVLRRMGEWGSSVFELWFRSIFLGDIAEWNRMLRLRERD